MTTLLANSACTENSTSFEGSEQFKSTEYTDFFAKLTGTDILYRSTQ